MPPCSLQLGSVTSLAALLQSADQHAQQATLGHTGLPVDIQQEMHAGSLKPGEVARHKRFVVVDAGASTGVADTPLTASAWTLP